MSIADRVGGEPGAARPADELVVRLHSELRDLAARIARGQRSVQATTLVQEAYLRLSRERALQASNREQFLGLAAQTLRRVLVDHLRHLHREKRGGGRLNVELSDEALARGDDPGVDVLALHEALSELETLDARQARVVELRFFGGLSQEECAAVLALEPAQVRSHWRLARAWLRRRLASALREEDEA